MLTRNYICQFICKIIFLAAFSSAHAQSLAVIHMQAENSLPYEVSWNGKSYPSSPNGYLMIPDVPAGNHTLIVDFSQEISLPYQFTVSVMDKPRGFSLRQELDNTWRLFDLTDFTLIQGQMISPSKPVEAVIKDPVITPPQKHIDNTVAVKKETPSTPKERFTKPAIIQKIFDKAGTTGIDQVYIITNGSKTDTIALFIPDLKEEPGKPAANQSTGSAERTNKKDAAYLFTATLVSQRLRKTLSK